LTRSDKLYNYITKNGGMGKMNVKKITKNDLLRQIKNGKELLTRVTRRIEQITDANKVLEAQLKAAKAYIGYLILEPTQTPVLKGIKKQDIAEFLRTKAVSWDQNDEYILITVKEMITDENEQTKV